MPSVVVSAPAKRDIRDVLAWSFKQFGDLAADRYRQLISAAIEHLAEDHEPQGSRSHPELPGDVRIYHLRNCAERAETESGRVKSPRHFVVYRSADDHLEVIRVLHDSMDLKQHV